jgi:ectoine hydroxylase-related dioxygenase (phytanoyl-CoA dioxygenase family)
MGWATDIMFNDTASANSATPHLHTDGYAVISGILSVDQVNRLSAEVSSLANGAQGTRKLLDEPWCKPLAEKLRVNPKLHSLLPKNAQAVQCTLFVKSVEKNWLVSLHQDLSIPVSARVESSKCVGWSDKEGDLFVQPPVVVLQEIVAIRVHLDDCDESTGALRVVPGSHLLGRLTSPAAIEERNRRGERSVAVPSGGVMIMRPLLLHASSKVSSGASRRVLHFVFGPPFLPEGLRWPAQNRSVSDVC